jgi:hypothetical protein
MAALTRYRLPELCYFVKAKITVAAGAAVRTWPFRVYSFPTDIRQIVQFPAWMFKPESYLFNPSSREELARLLGTVEKEKRGLNFSIAMTDLPVSLEQAMEIVHRPISRPALFSDAQIAKADWA